MFPILFGQEGTEGGRDGVVDNDQDLQSTDICQYCNSTLNALSKEKLKEVTVTKRETERDKMGEWGVLYIKSFNAMHYCGPHIHTRSSSQWMPEISSIYPYSSTSHYLPRIQWTNLY